MPSVPKKFDGYSQVPHAVVENKLPGFRRIKDNKIMELKKIRDELESDMKVIVREAQKPWQQRRQTEKQLNRDIESTRKRSVEILDELSALEVLRINSRTQELPTKTSLKQAIKKKKPDPSTLGITKKYINISKDNLK